MEVSSAALLIILQISFSFMIITHCVAAGRLTPSNAGGGGSYVEQSCSSTTYPQLCYETLSGYSNEIQNNPRILATKALSVALSSAKSTSMAVRNLSGSRGLSRREAGPMGDCVSVVGDSVFKLQKSVGELGRDISGTDFSMMISDVQTWVSAALTDENTCMNGFDDGGKLESTSTVKTAVRGQVLKVAHLTTNALALVNNFASTTQANQP
ncbi:hypothetical protein Dimus_002572 [Dionaea muscipula]